MNATDVDIAELTAALRDMGLAAEGTYSVKPLAGGVSCDVWRITLADGKRIVVKRALAKLRVAADWCAPPQRVEAEVAWFDLARSIDARLAPEVLGEDRARHFLAMEYMSPTMYPLWKSELAAGHVDPDFAAAVGNDLARIHAFTAERPSILARFANGVQFMALRLEPYLLYTADRHPTLAPRIRELSRRVAESQIAVMHGDVSPKNILCGRHGPVFLDAETACTGDPCFDLAFCLNHLLLKCAWRPEYTLSYLSSFDALASAYLEGITWEGRATMEARTAALLPALLLARVDGKSPVEYLTAAGHKALVRDAARYLLERRFTSLSQIREIWRAALRAHG